MNFIAAEHIISWGIFYIQHTRMPSAEQIFVLFVTGIVLYYTPNREVYWVQFRAVAWPFVLCDKTWKIGMNPLRVKFAVSEEAESC